MRMKHNDKTETATAPIAVIMISLNEGHNLEGVLESLKGWAQEVFLVDSYSVDDTVDIALRHGVKVVQRKFRGFGDQWNFALRELPITAPWTMKLDPDERLTDELKIVILEQLDRDNESAIRLDRRLWFMGRPLPVKQEVLRIWKTGSCRFSDVSVNEHPIVNSKVVKVKGELVHLDSPDLDHWLEKQNRYSTAEAIMAYTGAKLSQEPRIFGTPLQRRMWLKANFHRLPFRYSLFFLYNYFVKGALMAGWVGYFWSWLRADVMRFRDYKRREMEMNGRLPFKRYYGHGTPDDRVQQY
jgi:glycosyltransferase involved in cell wall biosynthesis